MTRRSMKIGSLAAIGSLLALAGCASNDDQGADGDGPDKIKVGIIQIAGLTPIYAAQELGYFAEEDLEVITEISSGGAASLPLLAQNDLQISQAPAVSVIQAREQGYDYTIIPPALNAESSPPGQTGVVVKEDSGIDSLADLEGKRIAVNTINSANWLYNRALLAQAGVDVSKVTYVEVPFPSMIDALNGGSVDAIDAPQPFLYIALEAGNTKVVGYTFQDVQPGVEITSYAVSQKWADENPDIITRFGKAMDKAIVYMRENDEEAKVLVAEFTGADKELVDAIPLPPWSTEISVESVQKTADLMLQEGVIKDSIDVAPFIMNPEE